MAITDSLLVENLSLLSGHPSQHPALHTGRHTLAVHRRDQVFYQRIELGWLEIQSLVGFS